MSQSRERYVPGRESSQEKCEKRKLLSRQAPRHEEDQHERHDAKYRGRKSPRCYAEAGYAHRNRREPGIHCRTEIDITKSAKDERIVNAGAIRSSRQDRITIVDLRYFILMGRKGNPAKCSDAKEPADSDEKENCSQRDA
jgi:hypothetical protein